MKKRRILYCMVALVFGLQGIVLNPSSSMGASKTVVRDGINSKKTQEKIYKQYKKDYPNCIQGKKEWKKKDGKYQYPVTPQDKEWGEYLSTEEKYAVCHINASVLDELSTLDLLQLVIECPMISDIDFYDTHTQAIEALICQFNGLDELIKREDCLDTMYNYYKKYKIPKQTNVDYETLISQVNSYEEFEKLFNENEELQNMENKDKTVKYTIKLCEYIFEYMSEKGQCTSDMQKKFKTIINKKLKDKEAFSLFHIKKETTGKENVLLKNNGLDSLSVLMKKAAVTLHTPDGENNFTYTTIKNVVEYTYYDVHGTVDKYINKCKDKKGGRMIYIVGCGTNAFNCYNYAWLYNYRKYHSLWQKCIINNDDGFRADRSYSHSDKATYSDQIVHYDTPGWQHAAYVTAEDVEYLNSLSVPTSEPIVESKWGPEGAVVSHPLSICPYANSGTKYEFYC